MNAWLSDPLRKGIAVAVIQVLLVCSIGIKFVLDRSHYPRVWARTVPIDPDLPIRGRYVRLFAVVEGVTTSAPHEYRDARLEVRDGSLTAVVADTGRHRIWYRPCGPDSCWTLDEPLAFFIPEDVADPSRRPPGEELWVEVTVPPQGPPRPIRLGVRVNGILTPLALR